MNKPLVHTEEDAAVLCELAIAAYKMTVYDKLRAEHDALVAQYLETKEQLAALESKEVCTVAHDDWLLEGCPYCRLSETRDRYEGLLDLLQVWRDMLNGAPVDSSYFEISMEIDAYFKSGTGAL